MIDDDSTGERPDGQHGDEGERPSKTQRKREMHALQELGQELVDLSRDQLAGIDLHFIHEAGRGPDPMPLLLLHGWPGSVIEFHKLLPMLTDPGRFGGDPADAFTVVAPSLPGYAFSFNPGQRRLGLEEIAEAGDALMRDVLGYKRYGAQGGDWGAMVTTAIGLQDRELRFMAMEDAFGLRTEIRFSNVRRNAGFVMAARLTGNGEMRILLGQILPNIMPIMVVQMSLTMGYAILNAAGLSFIGLGVRPPDAEWGIMVAEGANFIQSGEWWIALFPGATLMLAVFCFNLLGDGLRDIIDPRMRT